MDDGFDGIDFTRRYNIYYDHPGTKQRTVMTVSGEDMKLFMQALGETKYGDFIKLENGIAIKKTSYAGYEPVKVRRDDTPVYTPERWDREKPTNEQWYHLRKGVANKWPIFTRITQAGFIGLCKSLWNLGKEEELIEYGKQCAKLEGKIWKEKVEKR